MCYVPETVLFKAVFLNSDINERLNQGCPKWVKIVLKYTESLILKYALCLEQNKHTDAAKEVNKWTTELENFTSGQQSQQNLI